MKTFDEIYNELQGADQKEFNAVLKEAQKESTKKNKIALVICLIVDAIILNFTFTGIGEILPANAMVIFPILIPIIVVDFIIYIILSIIFSKNKIKYVKMYKEKIIKKIMNNFYGNLEYFPEKGMPKYIYQEPKYNEYYNKYNSEDYLEAVINEKYSIQMAEVLTEKEETHRDSDGKTSTTTYTIFHGLFAKVIMNKSINGELKILQNGATTFDKKQLKMDSGEFEKYFDVSATDKIVGMQLLTADVMEELMAFVKKTNMQYDVIIKNDILYLRFHCGSMFEPANIKKGYLNQESLREYFYMLNFTYNLSNRLIELIENTEI